MIVISDTSVISHLIQVNLLHLLKELYKEVVIPPSVKLEIEHIPSQKEVLEQSNWIQVKFLKDQVFYFALRKRLDEGESEAIALALELESDVLLIDEKKGRKIAKDLGIRIMGILGVLTEAKDFGLLIEVKPVLDRLIFENGFRISTDLYNRVLENVGEK